MRREQISWLRKVSQGVVFAKQTKLEDWRKENGRSIEIKKGEDLVMMQVAA